MNDSRKITVSAKLQRKEPRLPVYVVFSGAQVAVWKLGGTTVIEGRANGHAFGRRSIKAWGKGSDDWFLEFTAPFCRSAGIGVGDVLRLELHLADTDPPRELEVLLSGNHSLRQAWENEAEGTRREAGEYIRAAKARTTRERRAAALAERLLGVRRGS